MTKIHAVEINFSTIKEEGRRREKKERVRIVLPEKKLARSLYLLHKEGKRVVVIIIGRKTQRVPSRDSSGNYPVIKATDYRSEFCGA